MANKKVVVDPVTRIEGHLRMQAVLDENNPASQNHCLVKVMRHENNGFPAFFPKILQKNLKLPPDFRIQRTERFIQQQIR